MASARSLVAPAPAPVVPSSEEDILSLLLLRVLLGRRFSLVRVLLVSRPAGKRQQCFMIAKREGIVLGFVIICILIGEKLSNVRANKH